MPFIAEDLNNGARRPLDIAEIGLPPERLKRVRDFRRRIPIEVHIKNQLDRGGLLRIYHEVAVGVMGVSKQFRRKRQPAVEPLREGYLHTPASNVRLFLRNGGQKGKGHLAVLIQRENALAFKKHAHWMGELREAADHRDAVNNIPRQSGHAFGDD